ncbi:MAG: type II toxin-antitoxin system HicB family antitoxin [Patescibacteria group bacterium]
MKHNKTNFKSIVFKQNDQYVSQCLNIDIASFGKTKNEALANLQEAVELYTEKDNKK